MVSVCASGMEASRDWAFVFRAFEGGLCLGGGERDGNASLVSIAGAASIKCIGTSAPGIVIVKSAEL